MKVVLRGKKVLVVAALFTTFVLLTNVVFAAIYKTYPPYQNQGTDPPNGTCRVWANAKICVYADKRDGLVNAYSWDASNIGVGREAYGQFNRNPVPGNSPIVYEKDDFSVSAFWVAYGYLGPGYPSYSDASILLYLYVWTYSGWQLSRTYTWTISSWNYPNTAVYFSGTVSQWISSPPSGSGSYTVAARARTYAVTFDGSAVADFLYPYYMYIDYIGISD